MPFPVLDTTVTRPTGFSLRFDPEMTGAADIQWTADVSDDPAYGTSATAWHPVQTLNMAASSADHESSLSCPCKPTVYVQSSVIEGASFTDEQRAGHPDPGMFVTVLINHND